MRGWLPGGREGRGVEEKRRHQQVSCLLRHVVAQELSAQPAFRQAARCSEARVLLLEPNEHNGRKKKR